MDVDTLKSQLDSLQIEDSMTDVKDDSVADFIPDVHVLKTECLFSWEESLNFESSRNLLSMMPSVQLWCDRHKMFEINSTPTEFITRKCVLAIHKAMELDRIVFNIIDELKTIVREHMNEGILQRYYNGFNYILDSMTVHTNRIFESGDHSNEFKESSVIPFANLDSLAKCTVLGVKLTFLGFVKGPKDIRLNLAREIIKMNDGTAEWQHMMFLICRKIRHEDEIRFRDPPGKEELQSLGNAYALDPSNYKILISLCSTLLDFIKHPWTLSYGVKIGPLSFTRDKQKMCEFTINLMRKLVDDFPNSEAVNTAAGLVFVMHAFPSELRDANLALQCLTRALELNPSSSKVLYRLGMWNLEQENLEQAENYFKRSMVSDPANFIAGKAYFWMKARSPELTHADEVEELIESEFGKKWPKHVLVDFRILNACIFFSCRKPDAAVGELIQAYNYHEKERKYFFSKFFSMLKTIKYYHWNEELISSKDILIALTDYTTQQNNPDLKSATNNILIAYKRRKELECLSDREENGYSNVHRRSAEAPQWCNSSESNADHSGNDRGSGRWKQRDGPRGQGCSEGHRSAADSDQNWRRK